ncbi:MAG: DUF4249 domain-containing protein [Tannerella sp.]|jgi:hypothetical protein|nr:DUF4249 domain-containing protein [Tannerella sp.]
MKQGYILLIACTIFVFTACENEIPFNIKDNPPKLVLNAFFDSDKEENLVTLSLTGREEVSAKFDAEVSVYINGELKEQLKEQNSEEADPYKIAKMYFSKIKFKPGDIVKIEAKTADGKYHAWAEDVVPKPIEIDKVDTTTYIEQSSWGASANYRYIRIKTTFTDDPLEKNYYQIGVYDRTIVCGQFDIEGRDTCLIYEDVEYLNIREDIVLNEGRLPVDEDNSILEQTNNIHNVFDDSRLNGSYTMTVSTSFYSGWEQTGNIEKVLRVSLISLSEDLYYYYRALNLFDSHNYDDVLSLPISFPSNVHGGTGIVGFCTVSSKFIHYL